jgi:hypothetical protein
MIELFYLLAAITLTGIIYLILDLLTSIKPVPEKHTLDRIDHNLEQVELMHQIFNN